MEANRKEFKEFKLRSVEDYERFNTIYKSYIADGMSAADAYAKAAEALSPSADLTEEERARYDAYVFKNRLQPEEALSLVKGVQANEKEEAPSGGAKEEKPKKPSLAERFFRHGNESKNGGKEKDSDSECSLWNPYWPFSDSSWPFKDNSNWFSSLNLSSTIDEMFGSETGKRFRRMLGGNGGGKCSCGENRRKGQAGGSCNGRGNGGGSKACVKSNGADAPSRRVSDEVDREVKKILDGIPSDEISDANTKVKIIKDEPNNYEFKVNHVSPDGKSTYTAHCKTTFQ